MKARTRWILLGIALFIVALVLFSSLRPPALPAYQVESRPLVQQVVATGRVISTSRSQVGSEITGTVVERHVREGDRVQPGQLLVTLRAEDLEAVVREAEAALQQLRASTRPETEARLRQAEAQRDQAAREATRREVLFARQLVSREAMEQALEAARVAQAAFDAAQAAANAARSGGTTEAQLRERLSLAQAQLARTSIRAQREGIVLTRNVEPGDVVQPGRVLFEIAHSGDTEIEVPVDEKNLAVLREGQLARCIADAWPDEAFAATVNYIAPGIDAQRGTVLVRLGVEPVPAFLRQDMTVTVNIETGRREQALALPNDALLRDAQGAYAVLTVEDGRLARRPVTPGLRGVAMSEVTDGVAAGDWVLADAAEVTLGQGTRVRPVAPSTSSADTAAAAATRREPPANLD